MRQENMPRLRCSHCGGSPLRLRPGWREDEYEIATGTLECAACGSTFPIEHGIAELLPPDVVNRETKERERAAWRKLAEDGGYYNENRAFNLSLPYVEPDNQSIHWQRVKHVFPQVLEMMGPLEGKVVLDLGASTAWASRRFAERGATVYALDYNDDPYTGLGAGRLYYETGVHFERIRADGEHVPLADASVDFVFICAAFHHFDRPQVVAREMARVLKPGGQVFAEQEYYRPWLVSERDEHAKYDEVMKFREHGVNERNYTNGEYEAFLTRAGLDASTLVFRLDRFRDRRVAPFQEMLANREPLYHAPPLQRWPALRPLARLGFLPGGRHLVRFYVKNFTIVERLLIGTKPAPA